MNRKTVLPFLVLVFFVACTLSTPAATQPATSPPVGPIITEAPVTEPPLPVSTEPPIEPLPVTPELVLGPPIPHLSPNQAVVITKIEMFDASTGWALGGEADPGDHVLRTSDGGNTWADVTPPEPAPAADQSAKIATAFFLDANTAWVTYSFQDFFFIPNPPIVWFTQDGGATWQLRGILDQSGLAEHFQPSFMYFLDSQNGWLLVSVGAGMSHDYSFLFTTTDGGITWARPIDPVNSEYLQNCCKTGMAFGDSQTGIATAEQGPYVRVFVLWTQDGGVTWESQDLPSPESAPALFDDPNNYCRSHSPTFFSPQSALLGVSCMNFNNDSSVNFIYTSLDNGATWQTRPYPGGQLFFPTGNASTILALGKEIRLSTDGGVSWTLVGTVIWDGQFDFVSTQIGWAVARNEGEIALVYTTNGGDIWLELSPIIAP